MAITPAAGYQVDPSNPNGVVPIASTPQTPAPQAPTPSAPTSSGVNPNANYFNQSSSTVSPAVTTGSPQQTGASAQNTAQQSQLVAPPNGSVVDLLQSAGQDSSFASRQQLAQQFGIQNYTGTAAQNTDLSQKYLDAYNAKKGTPVPQNGGDARSALNESVQGDTSSQGTPEQQFFDAYAGMNPIQANLFQQLSGVLSTSNTQQSLTDLFTQESQAQGIPALNLQLADINKIMSGTEDDIRAEITNAGGFATESQVQALTSARNKTLINQANYLQNVINSKNDYVDNIVKLTGEDRQAASDALDQKLGITKTLFDMSTQMDNAAKSNYQSVIDSVGWDGLAQSVKDNPQATAQIESLYGMTPGELQSIASYQSPDEQYKALQLQNMQLQNKKLSQDLNTGPAISTQVVDLGNKKVLINSKTGQVISDLSSNAGSSSANPQQLALQQQTISDIRTLLSDPALVAAVGAGSAQQGGSYPGGSVSLATANGSKSNFIAGVQQLTQALTLDNLQNAKNNGATFGALSEGELNLLSQSATKLNTWAVKDGAGNVQFYNIDEKDFKSELDKINNFQKLDFVLKGGDPNSVGIQEMPDGTMWTKNSDGNLTQIQ